MFPFFRKGSGSQATRDRNNLVRDEHIKKKLKVAFANAVREVQKKYIGTEHHDIERNDESAQKVCVVLEAIFLHGYLGKPSVSGLKNIFSEKHQSHDGIPEVSFWSLLKDVTHKDVIAQLKHLMVTTEVGLCRAWIRLALNDHLMESYLDALLSDKENLRSYYTTNAFLTDAELPYIVRDILQGVADLNFNLNYNSTKLNAWNAEPLILCGLLPPDRKKAAVEKLDSLANNSTDEKIGQTLAVNNQSANESVHNESDISDTGEESQSSGLREKLLETIYQNLEIQNSKPREVNDSSIDGKENPEPATQRSSEQNHSDYDSASSTSNSLPKPFIGNQIGAGGWSGWSSAFEPATTVVAAETSGPDDQCREQPVASPANILQASFNAILKTYGSSVQPNRMVLTDVESTVKPSEKHEIKADESLVQSISQDENLREMNYEIVSPGFDFYGSDESRFQFDHLHSIAVEKGLDKQNFQCRGCGRPIGLIYGPYRICFFDGWYYCVECHEEEESVIPGKVIQSWDFKPLKVSKYNKSFILKIEEEPLFHIDEINPTLYNAVPLLNEIKMLRIQLQHIKSFVFTCQNDLIEDFRRRIWPREYLCDDVHQYSLLDLVQVNNGQLAVHLKKVISQFSKHIYKCSLCSQKGFICEICNDSRIIYPFEILTTLQCHRCQSLFHKACKKGHRCPKCIRLQFRAKKESGSIQDRIIVSQSNDSNLGNIGVL